MTFRKCFFGACLLLVIGCTPSTNIVSPPQQPALNGRPADCQPSLDATVDVSNGRTLFHWTLTNRASVPIWIAGLAGADDEPPSFVPNAFLIPPGDIMLVVADFEVGRSRGQFIDGWPTTRIQCIPPGGRTSGTIQLTATTIRDAIIRGCYSNAEEAGGLFGTDRTIDVPVAHAVQLAIQYWQRDPTKEQLETPEEMRSQPFRVAAAQSLIRGEKAYGIDRNFDYQITLSPRLSIDLPLAQPHQIYFHPGKGREH